MAPRTNVSLVEVIAAAGIGALAMYVLDPQSGRRRVTQARDQTRHLWREAGDAADSGWHDLRNRVSGLASDMRQRLHRDTPSDRTLQLRVRSELGRWVTHPHAVRVTSRDGHVVLGGCVLAAERAQLQRAVEGVGGVRHVELRLAVVDTPDGMPARPGTGPRPPRPMDERHAPASRLLGVGAGAALFACGLARRDAFGVLCSAMGLAIAADLAHGAYRARQRPDDDGAAESVAPPPIEATVPRDVGRPFAAQP